MIEETTANQEQATIDMEESLLHAFRCMSPLWQEIYFAEGKAITEYYENEKATTNQITSI